jgi:hypothetical protein
MCIIILKKIKNKIILAKNRDRNYKPRIQIVHELINGVEIAYIRDMNTEWCEGLNQYGIGIINAALEIEYDENPLNVDNDVHLESKRKYLNTLAKNKSSEIIDNIFDKNFYTDISLQGHNMIASPKFSLHLESKTNVKPIAKILYDDTYVFTNHGINLKNTGYLYGVPLISSILRKKLIDYEFMNNSIEEPEDVFKLMNKNYNDLSIDYHPYRNNKKVIWTTGQLLLNLTDKILMYQYDTENSYFMGIINNLPTDYTPIIKIDVKPTMKNQNNYNLPVSKDEIDKIINQYTKK